MPSFSFYTLKMAAQWRQGQRGGVALWEEHCCRAESSRASLGDIPDAGGRNDLLLGLLP